MLISICAFHCMPFSSIEHRGVAMDSSQLPYVERPPTAPSNTGEGKY